MNLATDESEVWPLPDGWNAQDIDFFLILKQVVLTYWDSETKRRMGYTLSTLKLVS